MKKKEEKLERRRLRKAVRTRRLLWLGITAAVIISLAVLVQYWPSQAPSPQIIPQESFVGIQHALVTENDDTIGTPEPGYVFADFSVRIMNCGYPGFPVGPSLFDLVIDSVTYKAATETANLSQRLEETTVANEQTVFGLIAYEIPAGSTIPDTPLVYTGQGFNITWTNDW